jgi:acetylornithine deacetylase/succinyl-diaminopimelate desuccinylase-like protein
MATPANIYQSIVEELLRFKSISTDPAYQGEMQATAKWLVALFRQHGFQARMVENYGNPIVVASYVVDKAASTALIYGHYDVQPAVQKEGWESDPFILTKRGDRLYGRGVIDNKGQVGVHIASVFALIANGKLSQNITFMIEGDEETGSPLLGKFVREQTSLLKADYVVVSDGEVVGGQPVLERGYRGCFNGTLTITTSSTDLHSGMYGGAVPSASQEMIRLLDQIVEPDGSILIPTWNDDVPAVDPQAVADHARLPFSEEEFQRITGVKQRFTSNGLDFCSQTTLQPSIVVTGIQSGYVGVGYRNSVPAQATAKINFRLAPGQDPQRLLQTLRDYLKEVLPSYVDWTLETDDPSAGIEVSLSEPVIQEAQVILTAIYGQEPLRKFVGGTIPIVSDFAQVLKVPQVLVPLANEDCAMHAANENFRLDHLERGLAFSEAFFSR